MSFIPRLDGYWSCMHRKCKQHSAKMQWLDLLNRGLFSPLKYGSVLRLVVDIRDYLLPLLYCMSDLRYHLILYLLEWGGGVVSGLLYNIATFVAACMTSLSLGIQLKPSTRKK